jgi:hypothetical protein
MVKCQDKEFFSSLFLQNTEKRYEDPSVFSVPLWLNHFFLPLSYKNIYLTDAIKKKAWNDPGFLLLITIMLQWQ